MFPLGVEATSGASLPTSPTWALELGGEDSESGLVLRMWSRGDDKVKTIS